jgi:2-polyprenyl-6-hydroxyphenyl methylase/3-demethylubiquinone-9 3-methyltransferase
MAIITTPYHGYLKNLLLAVTGKMDGHFNALWDHGTIKFWSVPTLTSLFEEVDLKREQVLRVGRVAALAKSMIVVFRKPRIASE